jgi:hypothetical protein
MWTCGSGWVALLFYVLPFLEVAYEKHSNSPLAFCQCHGAVEHRQHGSTVTVPFACACSVTKQCYQKVLLDAGCVTVDAHITAPLGMPLPHVQQNSENAVLRHVSCFVAMVPGTGTPIQPVTERVWVITYTVTCINFFVCQNR